MDKIELRYDLTGDDLTHFMQKTLLRLFRILGIVAIVLAAIIGLGLLANPDLPLKMIQSPIIMALIFLVGIPLLMRFNNRRIVNKNPQHYQNIHFITSDQGVEINTAHAETRMKWGQFQKVKKTDKMYLL
ncbi:MAG: YcxB family protein, partial [Bacteroidota bacterium]